ncbi:MAG: 50S ribosomal protein L13 [Verrucomicrobia bacterium ADurb.Bin345]|nr:MAG: 50S ribosomal protein L13 [Verrucomicrobia bacterium ADurb.Bin345]
MKTTLVDEKDVQRVWYVVDAANKPVGRLAAKIAHVLRGKTKPAFAPQSDLGDFVVVLNAEKVRFTGSKEEQKTYTSYSRFPGGLRRITAGEMRKKHPEYLLSHAVKNMLPKNKLSRQMFARLKIYTGTEHPHAAQKPQALEL